MEAWFLSLLEMMRLPKFGLTTVFIVALVSSTLMPIGSEPAVFGLVKINPDMFWPAILVATVGATLGGMVTWWMGYGAEQWYEHTHQHKRFQAKALTWLEGFGPKACLLSWLPVVGDPLCAVAGWLQLPFWPCTLYMAIGKFGRYLVMTYVLLWMFPKPM